MYGLRHLFGLSTGPDKCLGAGNTAGRVCIQTGNLTVNRCQPYKLTSGDEAEQSESVMSNIIRTRTKLTKFTK